jgi:methionyl aminopeptidase
VNIEVVEGKPDVIQNHNTEEMDAANDEKEEQGTEGKKKKKKHKSKAAKAAAAAVTEITKDSGGPPMIPISVQFSNGIKINFYTRKSYALIVTLISGIYPIGQITDHGPAEGIDERTAKDRFSSEEKKAIDRMHNDIYNEVRHAAEAHRQVFLSLI